MRFSKWAAVVRQPPLRLFVRLLVSTYNRAVRLRRRIRKNPAIRSVRRRQAIRRAEICIVSYPKSGRTWLRFLIGRAVTAMLDAPQEKIPETSTLWRLSERVPRILVTHDDFAHRKRPEDVERDKRLYTGKRVVLLLRDPRDVIVSLHFHRRYRSAQGEQWPESLSQTLRLERGGFRSLIAFYNAWANGLSCPEEILVIRYEQLKYDTARELQRVLNFMGLGWIDRRVVAEAVQYCSFTQMKAIERDATVRFSTGSWSKRSLANPESFKVRQGRVGGYRAHTSAEDRAYLETVISRELDRRFDFYRKPSPACLMAIGSGGAA